MRCFYTLTLLVLIFTSSVFAGTGSRKSLNKHKQISGVYPHLTMYNNEGECGTGAIVPWGERLWVITYGPHKPTGSSDKLYEITPDLDQIIRPESVGGTPANRMIHKESKQLNIGPYLIKEDGTVRTVHPKVMPGRLTATARHLIDPKNIIYIATMEEGLYSLDVHTLQVTEHIKDGNSQKAVGKGVKSELPGYHGKGLYSGQDRVIYANNGERSKDALIDPNIPSGSLGQWFGDGDWQLVRRNQFTEVTGPGGIYGNTNPETDPVWSMGWDYYSVILMLLDKGKWHAYRLPKGSHSCDGAHGWNTEWPRIRDIEEKKLLATMHGTFWYFPKTFSLKNSAGIAPLSNYLKVIGDFCRWNNYLVFGCDDSAQKEFLNRRPFKSEKGAPIQSNSNLWFINPTRLTKLGPVIGRGSVWLKDDIKAGQTSDPYLFDGYDYRMMVITHKTGKPINFILEVDQKGNNTWKELRTFEINDSLIHIFKQKEEGAWIRIKTEANAEDVSVHFSYRNKDNRSNENNYLFDPITKTGALHKTKGLIRSNRKVLSLANGNNYYEVNDKLEIKKMDDNEKLKEVQSSAQPQNIISVDQASAIIREDNKTYRIPKNDSYKNDLGRICREVATERDLLNFHGTFYELPARNAQGFAKIRPISTHNLKIDDYASHFGMMFITGLNDTVNEHVIKSDDGNVAVWSGVIDDLWKLGKPRGEGGPWKNTHVKASQISDPYLMTGYDKKYVELISSNHTEITIEIDIDGTGIWVPYKTFIMKPGEKASHAFPEGFSAYWIRSKSSADTTATVWLKYE